MLKLKSLITTSFVLLISSHLSLTRATHINQEHDQDAIRISSHLSFASLQNSTTLSTDDQHVKFTEPQDCLTPLNLPAHFMEYIVAFLDCDTKLHHVNKYLFTTIVDYPAEQILNKGFGSTLADLRTSKILKQHSAIVDFKKYPSNFLPNYFLHNFVTVARNLPQCDWSHLQKTRITELLVSGYKINDNSVAKLSTTSARLERLTISHTDITDASGKSLGHIIAKNNLKFLQISYIGLDDNGSIIKTPSQFSDNGARAIGRALAHRSSPFKLLLLDTAIEPTGLYSLVDILAKNSNVHTFITTQFIVYDSINSPLL